MAFRYQLALAGGVAEKVETLTEQARDSDTFGNTRSIRQLFEKALENQALRLTADDDPQLLPPEDFHALERSAAEPPFGFH